MVGDGIVDLSRRIGARRQPPVWMQPGDVIEVEVDKVGVLRNTVADD